VAGWRSLRRRSLCASGQHAGFVRRQLQSPPTPDTESKSRPDTVSARGSAAWRPSTLLGRIEIERFRYVGLVGNGETVVGYVRVSTEEQGISGAGLDAQRRSIADECARRGWTLLRVEEDVLSGRTTSRRRPLRQTVCALRARAAFARPRRRCARRSSARADPRAIRDP
jgi:hypothetical protein